MSEKPSPYIEHEWQLRSANKRFSKSFITDSKGNILFGDTKFDRFLAYEIVLQHNDDLFKVLTKKEKHNETKT